MAWSRSHSFLRILDGTHKSTVGATPDLINVYWTYAQPGPRARLGAALRAVTHEERTRVLRSRGSARHLRRAIRSARDTGYRRTLGTMFHGGLSGPISIENCGEEDPLETTAQGRRYLERMLEDHAERRLTFVYRPARRVLYVRR